MGIGEETGIVKQPRASAVVQGEGVRSAIVVRRKAKRARELGRMKEGEIYSFRRRDDAMPEADRVIHRYIRDSSLSSALPNRQHYVS
jgi:glutamyl-tRNA reductase